VSGDIALFGAPDNVVAFRRKGDGEEVLCAFNLGDQPCEWAPPAEWDAARLLATEGAVGAPGALPHVLAPGAGYWAARGE